ncbi:MAG: undecaprenyldiphospho-muramoylpentapeptide beta-N-acetylglucosaminyltransferase [Candidatus Zambryskibacteria bacterium RIFCSPHIGHO2_01_FULL_43_25]|uniref:UDP-N-acetylglucosamine--N-acetylmuramyl-(pentapeptide) pyrophosphoryl-undecaprenol N-acetylglucosamine transferase n=1 Tax=Candidatus Zambryskibacteria bacterium RIFCSPLOWO2_01_FULL_45_21 TaxID=1802761 RepID=A0A1G2U331_9BACT|nr:MAG: undecaprenyldiphospho-muramoylpentapeptide beta-N-acetylglucosaminyltransferase [Candidatus Zambryskibacteria bacterium RIFCSPHIGHO2_01_FULL_43_25]OHB01061.1 MAG: undecaprenyldiphospho-muramoylpentapeptide beta-N-acetylglucosaminyltransferase [Candidatus Zambryskibacteria bacterium RIFCSPHIGHO2_12_FULL_44_12b]OHB03894.1 MAG: undecaprenyldiphospho-muramoylpentapeptide beta-N-acetylglucosaminyltransferase [Candidatus Zambryskibacteria bacterium RIFCSPLOWO2_01_FULL_45_21]
MKFLLTGGGTGGHFYPIVAIAQELKRIAGENRMVDFELYFMSHSPYNQGILYDNNLIFKKNYAGKIRRYFSVLNFFDLFKTGWGIIKSVWEIFLVYPDVVFGKGGYASFPALFAARILRIPVVIHESDSVPGKTNLWAAKFARRIAVSYQDAAKYFPKDKVAFTGQPIRKEIRETLSANAHEYFGLDKNIPVVLILGGSLGASAINEVMMEALPKLVEKYQIIHQTGKDHLDEVKKTVEVVLQNNPNKNRYKAFPFLNDLELRSAAGAATIVISRAGSSIFEIASWGIPSIIIPIPSSNGDHQTKNAFAYARTGAAAVIEQNNLSGNILFAEIERITSDPELYQKMKESTKNFVRADAATLIAEEILKIALKHEQ